MSRGGTEIGISSSTGGATLHTGQPHPRRHGIIAASAGARRWIVIEGKDALAALAASKPAA